MKIVAATVLSSSAQQSSSAFTHRYPDTNLPCKRDEPTEFQTTLEKGSIRQKHKKIKFVSKEILQKRHQNHQSQSLQPHW